MSQGLVLCPACRHPVRQHGDDGCTRGECLCESTKADLNAAATTRVLDRESARRALLWWDAWYCPFCLNRYFTERDCCNQPAVPVRVMVLPRQAAA